MIELSADDKRMIADAVEASAQGKDKKHDVLKVIHFVEKTGLSPLLDEISFLYRSGKMSIHVPTRTYRKIAQSNPRYQGQTATQWAGSDGLWRDVWLEKTPPAAAKVGVFVQGFKEPCWGVAIASEWSSGSGTWREKPAYMLGPKAEGLALKQFVNITGADAAIDSEDPVDEETNDTPESVVPDDSVDTTEAEVEPEEVKTETESETLVDRCTRLKSAIQSAETANDLHVITASDDMMIVAEENAEYFDRLVKYADNRHYQLSQS